jgi:predicted nuclease of predicted toxin-antitoxin system
MTWARERKYVVFTNDLDFGALLAATHADSPSVFQLRAHDLLPERVGALVLTALAAHETVIQAGALIVVDETSTRARILPLRGRGR